MKRYLKIFWGWYDRHYTLHISIAAVLFLLQLFHLYWLSTNVVTFKIFSQSYFNPSLAINLLIALADYIEIPALVTTSVLYLRQNQLRFEHKNLWFLFLINSQWLHLFWITDEVVVTQLTGSIPLPFPYLPTFQVGSFLP